MINNLFVIFQKLAKVRVVEERLPNDDTCARNVRKPRSHLHVKTGNEEISRNKYQVL